MDDKSSIKDFYDSLYTKNPSAFGDTTQMLLDYVFSHTQIPAGKALDLGAGEGRASLYLANKGYAVTAVDISSNAFTGIKKEANPSIQIVQDDVARYVLRDHFSVIISSLTFHHLTREETQMLIKQCQQHTVPKGLNIFRFFTKDSGFFFEDVGTGKFFSAKNEMEKLYDGWHIVYNDIEQSKATTGDKINTIQTFIAQLI